MGIKRIGRGSRVDGDLRLMFRRNMPSAQWTAIESGSTVAGIPDSEYCFPGNRQGWVEHKQIGGWVVTLRPAQIGWLLTRARMGGRCFVAIRKGDLLWLRPGSEAKELREVGVKWVPCWRGGPGSWPWDRVAAILSGVEPHEPFDWGHGRR